MNYGKVLNLTTVWINPRRFFVIIRVYLLPAWVKYQAFLFPPKKYVSLSVFSVNESPGLFIRLDFFRGNQESECTETSGHSRCAATRNEARCQ